MRDERFASLSHPTRQRVLSVLSESDETDVPLTVPDDLDDGTGDRDQLHLALYHVHLPKLQAAGYVTWDIDESTITKGSRFDEVEPLLDVLAG
jgi:DNA-binding transcriptional ArsR family regulator